MKISEIQIYPIKPKDGLVAFASVVLEDRLFIGSVGVHTRLDGSGLRITYPTKKVGDKDMNIFHPISKGFGAELERAIITKAETLLTNY